MLGTNTEFLTEQNCLGGARCLLMMANLSVTSRLKRVALEIFWEQYALLTGKGETLNFA